MISERDVILSLCNANVLSINMASDTASYVNKVCQIADDIVSELEQPTWASLKDKNADTELGEPFITNLQNSLRKVRDQTRKLHMDILKAENNLIKKLRVLRTHSRFFDEGGYSDIKSMVRSKNKKVVEEAAQVFANTTLALKEDIQNEQKRILYLQSRLQTLNNVFAPKSTSGKCALCLAGEDITHCFIKCGHSLCNKCVKEIGQFCPFCRSHIKKIIRIYM